MVAVAVFVYLTSEGQVHGHARHFLGAIGLVEVELGRVEGRVQRHLGRRAVAASFAPLGGEVRGVEARPQPALALQDPARTTHLIIDDMFVFGKKNSEKRRRRN